MGIIPFIIFIAIVFGKSQQDNRRTGAFRIFFGMWILMAVLSVFGDNPFFILALIVIIIYIVMQIKKQKEVDERSKKYGWDPHRWDKENQNMRTPQLEKLFRKQQRAARKEAKASGNANSDFSNTDFSKAGPLPGTPAKRKRIIEDFNEKYNLCLTTEQIQSITNSSYMSEIWHREVQSMNQKYNIVYEWFPGNTAWLRVYMYAFHVQEITSDMRQQENIAMYAFEEVFRFSDSLPDMPTGEKIERINSEFFTSFDDATFMIAYRFLEGKGLHHKLSGPDLVKDEDEVDELLHKYRKSPQDGV